MLRLALTTLALIFSTHGAVVAQTSIPEQKCWRQPRNFRMVQSPDF